MIIKKFTKGIIALSIFAALISGCASLPKDKEQRRQQEISEQVTSAEDGELSANDAGLSDGENNTDSVVSDEESDTDFTESDEENSESSLEESKEKNTSEEIKVDISSVDIEYMEDETTPIWKIKKELDSKTSWSDHLPDSLTIDNFVAYHAYKGYASENVNFLVNKDDEFLMVYRLDSAFGDQTMQTGIVKNPEELLQIISSLPYKEVESPELDGEDVSYGTVYYEEDGEIFSFYTVNIFENDL